jgi:electron transfer flavoprotein beta subunit
MIGVCLKWVDTRPEVDSAGSTTADNRFSGISRADQAALEWALRCGEQWNQPVTVVSVGPPDVETVLRNAIAVGAARAVRVEANGSASQEIADALAIPLHDVTLIFCGDYSLDRGTGSVPAFLAARLEIGQALGLVQLGIGEPDRLSALRRLDGGRRERLAINSRAVISVEGSTAMLRRASLRALLAGGPVEVITGPAAGAHSTASVTRPYRPRARALASPVGETALQRVISLTAAGAVASSGETVILEPAAAADRIMGALRDWGYAQ